MSGSELSGIYSLVFVSFYLLWEGSSLGTIRNENLTCSRKVIQDTSLVEHEVGE